MNAVAINPLQNFKIRFQNFFPLCKPRVSALIVFTAIIGMFLATPNMVPLDILIAATEVSGWHLVQPPHLTV